MSECILQGSNAITTLGMAKAGPDTDGEAQGGFDSNAFSVRGFSHMHDSGTGGVMANRFLSFL